MDKDDARWFEADKDADTLERAAGIAEPPQKKGSFLLSILLPCIALGIVLIIGFWELVSWLHLLD